MLEPRVLDFDFGSDLVALHVLYDHCLLLVNLPKLGVLDEQLLDF